MHYYKENLQCLFIYLFWCEFWLGRLRSCHDVRPLVECGQINCLSEMISHPAPLSCKINLLSGMMQNKLYEDFLTPERDILELLLTNVLQADRRMISH